MMVVGKLAMIVAVVAMAMQTDPSATWTVQAEHASTTPVMEVAQPVVTVLT
jgi:hypothetical protein